MDLIVTTKYWDIVDWHFDKNDPKLQDGRIVAVDPTAIKEFFELLNNTTTFNRKENYYIVVTCRSDYGIVYQKKNPPAADLPKWIKFQMNVGLHGYNDLFCKARLNLDRCNINDTYSVKCYAYTDSTFNDIPKAVKHWFIANCEIDDPRVTSIPFGVQDEPAALNELDSFNHSEYTRLKTLYCNWQFYTMERAESYAFFDAISKYPGSCGDITCKRNVSHVEYLKDLASHRFVFCPRGNGLDCYRNLETYYAGAIPVFELKDGVPKWIDDEKLPYVGTPDYRTVPLFIDGMKAIQWDDKMLNFKDKLTFSYWRKKILCQL